MAEYEERILDREVRISRYVDGSFATATARDFIQLLDGQGQPFGDPAWKEATLTRAELVDLLGEAAVAAREALTEAGDNYQAKRAEWLADRAALVAANEAALEALTTEATNELAAREAQIAALTSAATQKDNVIFALRAQLDAVGQ